MVDSNAATGKGHLSYEIKHRDDLEFGNYPLAGRDRKNDVSSAA